MKKILYSVVSLSMLAVPFVGLAAEAPPGTAPEIITTGVSLLELINNIGNWIFTGLLVIASVFLIIAGVLFVTAAGNPDQIKRAREMLINALIGVGVGLGAKGMVAVIASILGAGG